ncbi:ADP-ribosylglycohydrolase family protein [Planotetraspora sp. A-T 1434]|uniref:ADP-ribosylglycohydrolase family protein n=1 Tax=Planotetraspora sp. A-T 1434 TaxID=2979219 RepID=UPI0021BFF075|nr:ADP-ribosylglycohydrolase family protein [Planotetraspora sp. A-T 1434]MCT9934881.1 ADP-ribosylglycohydrolase family protein [Planotetraspora sp. A-T 1434]
MSLTEMGNLPFQARVRGCLLGGAIGDALGAPIEFDSIAAIRRNHGKAGLGDLASDWRGKIGLVTDDTQMTLFTVEGLIRAHVRVRERGIGGGEVQVVRHAYLRWLDTQEHRSPPPADHLIRTGRLRQQTWLYSRRAPGNACLSGLRADLGPLAAPGTPGPVNPGSKGCGTVMRSAPFGLAANDPSIAFKLAADCAQITHGHPTGYLAAGAFAAMVSFLILGRQLAEAVQNALDLLNEQPAHEETTAAIQAAVTLAARAEPAPEAVETLGGGWVAEEALAIAVYCALVSGDDVEHALLLAVNHSGDSDSTGAVCGNLLGAQYGEAALPQRWLSRLEGRDAITELADDFTTQYTGGRLAWDKYPGC